MSEYTPTTDEIENAWCSRYDGEHSWASGEELRGYEAEFNRWLEQTLREAKAEAWHEGYGHGLDDQEAETRTNQIHVTLNPYRQENQ